MWSVVLGDYDRHIESGYEQRIAIDRIVMHDNYENYQHDVVLMRLSRPADLAENTITRQICMPFISTENRVDITRDPLFDDNDDWSNSASSLHDDNSNYLRRLGRMIARRGGSGKQRRRNDKFVHERNHNQFSVYNQHYLDGQNSQKSHNSHNNRWTPYNSNKRHRLHSNNQVSRAAYCVPSQPTVAIIVTIIIMSKLIM